MSRIAIVAALEREVRPLVKPWRVVEQEHAGRTFRVFESEEAVLVCGGIGAEAARRAAEAIIAAYTPSIIYSVGFAGALDTSLAVADVFRPSRVVNAADGSSVALSDGSGMLISFASVARPEQKWKLSKAFGGVAVDMEAAAVARAAEARGIGFGVVKAISDASDFQLPPTERFVRTDGTFSELRFALYCAVRPWMWPRVVQLARNSGRASRALCEALRNMLRESKVHVPRAI